MNLDYLQGIISPIFDLWIFYKVFKYKFAIKDSTGNLVTKNVITIEDGKYKYKF